MRKKRMIFQNSVQSMISDDDAEIENVLSDWFSSSGFYSSFKKSIAKEDSKITVFVVEDYYFRINTTVTLTVIVERTAKEISIDIISGGGNMGFFGSSLGAEQTAVNRVIKRLEYHGFTER